MSKGLKNFLIFFLVISICIALEVTIGGSYVRDENIFLIFILAILIILIETQNIIYGISASVVFVLTFNYFCTTPLYRFQVDDINYYVSFVIFIIISLIVGSLVSKLQRQIIQSKQNEKRIKTMYEFSKKFLNTHNEKDIYSVVLKYLSSYFSRNFYAMTIEGKVYGEELDISGDLKKACEYAVKKNIMVGAYQMRYSNLDYIIFPLKSKVSSFGVLLVEKGKSFLNEEEISFIENILYELIVVLEREIIIVKQEKTQAAIEKEKFKTTILRSLSHDLKTPLTSIQSGSLFLYDNYDKVDDDSKKELLLDIYNESLDLTNFVMNLLNLSRLDDPSRVEKEYESIEDILQGALERVSIIDKEKRVHFPNEVPQGLIYCNAKLLIQVIYNLVDNALKHLKDDSKVEIKVKNDKIFTTFEVIDDGEGIKEEMLGKLFKDFDSLMAKQDHKRSTGLGLSICKSIVQAHGGIIEGFNNEKGGASFVFKIKNEREDRDDINN